MNRNILVGLLSDLLVIVGLAAIGVAIYLGAGLVALLAFIGTTLVVVGGLVAWRTGRAA